ncbi:MAG: Carbamate kinase [Ignavibacteriae bacterium]|nr:MAG: Carbamate kinase [Ignavibacteriota bacterium]
MKKVAVVAIGGNSLIRAGQRGTIEEQFENVLKTAEQIVKLYQLGFDLIITHGNGPQVGAQLLRSELASSQVYTEPLDVCVADTQGSMGYMIQHGIQNVLAQNNISVGVATIITQVIVDKDDPGFKNPNKPIGPFYSKEEAEKRALELGWKMVEDAQRGYRRVVPSPIPLEIVELEFIKSCIEKDLIVISVGGGGIPVVKENSKLKGVEAVIDKDRASSLLASKLNADVFIISTDAEYVCLNYKKPNQSNLKNTTLADIQEYYKEGHFPPGNMGPKIEAAISFLKNGGKEVIITSPENLVNAVQGLTGTHITH